MILLSQIYQRLDWFEYGIASISRTGAFIACAIIATWFIAAILKKGFWISLISSIILFNYLIQTQSRGAIVSLIVAFIVLLSLAKFKVTKIRFFAVIIAMIIVFVFYCHSYTSTRMQEMVTLQSSSANCRADLYLSGLKMYTDAPYGIEDDPADVYMTWYQDLNDTEQYVSLINSHLEFTASKGFLKRLSYVLFLSIVFAITFPKNRNPANAVIFSTWLCYVLSATFSNVMNYWALWIIPTLLLLFSLYSNRSRFKDCRFYIAIATLSAVTTSALYVISYILPRDSDITFLKNGDVLVRSPKVTSTQNLLYKPNSIIVGSKYGKELDLFCNKNNSTVYVSNSALDTSVTYNIVIACELSKELFDLNYSKLVLLNPTFNPDIQLPDIKEIQVIIGNFSDWRNRKAWENVSAKNTKIIKLPGVADYIPNWIDYFNK